MGCIEGELAQKDTNVDQTIKLQCMSIFDRFPKNLFRLLAIAIPAMEITYYNGLLAVT